MHVLKTPNPKTLGCTFISLAQRVGVCHCDYTSVTEPGRCREDARQEDWGVSNVATTAMARQLMRRPTPHGTWPSGAALATTLLLACTTLGVAQDESPALVHVAHDNAEVRLGTGGDYVSVSRIDPVDDHSAATMVLDANVHVTGNLTVEGRVTLNANDMVSILLRDLVAENIAQDVERIRLQERVAQLEAVVDAMNETLAHLGSIVGVPVGTESNPASSCRAILDKHQSSESGIYFIDFYGAHDSTPVYCDMSFDGGGWTLLVAQDEDHYFSASASDAAYWPEVNADAPSPTSELYSILGRVDALRGPQGDLLAQYWYEETQSRTSYGDWKWVKTRQPASVLATYASSFSGTFDVLSTSHSGHGYLTGYGKTVADASSCVVDG